MSFETLGISKNSLPAIAGKFSGRRLVIVGSGRCVWEDLIALGPFTLECPGWNTMALNDMIVHFPFRLHHVWSNDHRPLKHWLEVRRPEFKKLDDKIEVHTEVYEHGWHAWPWPMHGTSALNACYTGLALGYEQIVLCGVPLDDSGYYWAPPWIGSQFDKEVPDREDGLRYWSRAEKEVFDGKVKSMSGRTKALLGSP